MQIELKILKEVVDQHVKEISDQLEGEVNTPFQKMTKFEAIEKLGLISSLVISLEDKVNDSTLREKIWDLKREADTMIEKLFEK